MAAVDKRGLKSLTGGPAAHIVKYALLYDWHAMGAGAARTTACDFDTLGFHNSFLFEISLHCSGGLAVSVLSVVWWPAELLIIVSQQVETSESDD